MNFLSNWKYRSYKVLHIQVLFKIFKSSVCMKFVFQILFGSKDLSCFVFHMIVLLCCSEFHMVVLKAEQAARDSRYTKQDRYAEMRRRKDEEREAKENMLVSDISFFRFSVCMCCACVCVHVGFLVEKFCGASYRKKKQRLVRPGRRKLLH